MFIKPFGDFGREVYHQDYTENIYNKVVYVNEISCYLQMKNIN